MKEVDFEEEWAERFEARRELMQKDYEIEGWTRRSEDYSDSRRTNDYEYGRNVLDTLMRYDALHSDSLVLEVGSGPGTFVIPFARKIAKITAVEPARGMIEKIMRNAEEAGIENFEIINKIWQEVRIPDIARKYDLVITSTVIWMFKDIWEQLQRMEQASKGCCCLVTGTGGWDGEGEKLWQEVMGDLKRPDYQEYPLIYNLLYSKGRLPNVRMITYISERSVDNMITMKRIFFEKYTDVTPDVERIITEHVLKNSDGGICRNEGRAAVIWWDACEGC
ncbi:MAG: class I SAM-dependent methyltransferase [Euryarchaeota archaeon]|nr:class I SAM-dependent methyltransferase [Euryarchaeota archaeon]